MNIDRKKMVIYALGFTLFYVVLSTLNSKFNNKKTNIKDQYECYDCYLYPYNYYLDEDKKLIQIELTEINSAQLKEKEKLDYNDYDSGVSFAVYNHSNRKKDYELISSGYRGKDYAVAQQRKYILQMKYENEKYIRVYINQNESELDSFIINIDDFQRKNLIKKDENYFKKMEYLEENILKESNELLENEFKKMDDTGFCSYDMMESKEDDDIEYYEE